MYSFKNLNKTNWEHTLITAALQFGLTVLMCLFFTPTFELIFACALPGCYLFFGREHAQASSKLKNKYKEPEITSAITNEAMRFWQWSEDGFWDFVLPVLGTCVQTPLHWLFWLVLLK